MNLIEAWNEAKEGQKVARPSNSAFIKKECNKLQHFITDYIVDSDLLANDWEIIKIEKKIKVMPKRISWGGDINRGYVIHLQDLVKFPDELLKAQNTPLTITWEE